MNEMSTMYCSSNYLSLRTKVYEDVDKLRRRIKAALEELDQRIIDTAVRQWRTRLHSCVKAKSDHFEHKLPWPNDEMPDKYRSIRQLVFIAISEFLIKCVFSLIAHYIRDRVELVSHCFSQYCESNDCLIFFAECDAYNL